MYSGTGNISDRPYTALFLLHYKLCTTPVAMVYWFPAFLDGAGFRQMIFPTSAGLH